MKNRFVNVRSMCRAALLSAIAILGGQNASMAQIGERPIRIIMPFSAGSGWDSFIRVLAHNVEKRNSESVIVENKPGAGTIVGANACKTAVPDGKTICVLTTSSMLLNPLMHTELSYDPIKDFEPITTVAFVDHVVIMGGALPASNFTEFVQYAKAHPGKLNFGSNGVGSDLHLLIEWIAEKNDIKLTHVPYRGIAPAMLAFEAGQIQLLALTPGSASLVERINSGDVKALAVDSDRRLSILPNVPTFQEVGMPAYELRGWLGLFAPKGTPKEVIAKLNRDIVQVVKDPSFQKQYMIPFGFVPVGSSPAALAKRIADTQDEAAELFKLSGVKPQP